MMFDRLEAVGISKRYEEVTAVERLSFHVDRGEVLGLAGPNGSGKSTTIGMLAGLIVPDAGEFRIDAERLDPASMAFRSQLGIVPQEVALYPELTVEENLDFFAALHDLERATRRERIEQALNVIGIADLRRRRVRVLSGGIRRRLNFVIGFLNGPGLLLLDEPAVGCDVDSREIILDTIRSLASNGTSVVVSTHSERTRAVCDRVVVLDG